jgi:hypothetical protein
MKRKMNPDPDAEMKRKLEIDARAQKRWEDSPNQQLYAKCGEVGELKMRLEIQARAVEQMSKEIQRLALELAISREISKSLKAQLHATKGGSR